MVVPFPETHLYPNMHGFIGLRWTIAWTSSASWEFFALRWSYNSPRHVYIPTCMDLLAQGRLLPRPRVPHGRGLLLAQGGLLSGPRVPLGRTFYTKRLIPYGHTIVVETRICSNMHGSSQRWGLISSWGGSLPVGCTVATENTRGGSYRRRQGTYIL